MMQQLSCKSMLRIYKRTSAKKQWYMVVIFNPEVIINLSPITCHIQNF